MDDGSSTPIRSKKTSPGRTPTSRFCGTRRAEGPAAARNTGLAACKTGYVAFLDSDVVPRRGWLEALLGHFCDPTVALVAPRIVGLAQTDHLVARYEAVRSSLDLGHREAPVIPYTSVSYVPSAAIICRTSALRDISGFDETLRSGEDVDLCWRLVEAGARLRYEPIAQVAHDHRTELRDWVARKAFYGGSAAPLSVRHPDKIAPLMISGWALTAWILMAFGSSFGYLASTLRCRAHRPPGREKHAGHRDPGVGCRDGGCPQPVVGGPAVGVGDLPALLAGRTCWQPSCSARAAGLSWSLPSSTGWWTGPVAGKPPTTMPKPIGLLTYLLLKRIDDLAYGSGTLVRRAAGAQRRSTQAADSSLTPDRSGAAQRCAGHRRRKRWICCRKPAFG